jgi:hypothetical protein
VLYLDAHFLQGMIILSRRLCQSRSTTLKRRSHLDVLTDEQNPSLKCGWRSSLNFPPNRPKLLPLESSRLTRNGNISRLKHFSPRTSRRDHQEQCYHLLVLRGRVLNPQSYHSAFRISSTRHLDSRMYCWPALRVRFRLAQNFSGHWSNVALPAENIMDEV